MQRLPVPFEGQLRNLAEYLEEVSECNIAKFPGIL